MDKKDKEIRSQDLPVEPENLKARLREEAKDILAKLLKLKKPRSA